MEAIVHLHQAPVVRVTDCAFGDPAPVDTTRVLRIRDRDTGATFTLFVPTAFDVRRIGELIVEAADEAIRAAGPAINGEG